MVRAWARRLQRRRCLQLLSELKRGGRDSFTRSSRHIRRRQTPLASARHHGKTSLRQMLTWTFWRGLRRKGAALRRPKVIANTTFLIHYIREKHRRVTALPGPSCPEPREIIRTSVISVGEVAVSFRTSAEPGIFSGTGGIYPLHQGIAEAAADVDRELIATEQD